MELSEEHRMIKQMVREFALGEVKPLARELDETGEVNWDLYKKMAELGLLGMPFPEEWGGGDTDTLGYTIGVEEISRVCGSTGLSMAAHTSPTSPTRNWQRSVMCAPMSPSAPDPVCFFFNRHTRGKSGSTIQSCW